MRVPKLQIANQQFIAITWSLIEERLSLEDAAQHIAKPELLELVNSESIEELKHILLEMAKSLGQIPFEIGSLVIIQGEALRDWNRNFEALSMFRLAEEIFRINKMDFGVALSLKNIAYILGRLVEYEKSVKIYDDAIKIFKEIGNDLEAAYCIEGQGITLEKMGRVLEALKKFDQAEIIIESKGPVKELAKLSLNRGILLLRLSHYNQALEDFKRAEDIFNAKGGQAYYVASCKLNRGISFNLIGRYKSSVEILEEAEEIFKSLEARKFDVEIARCKLNRAAALVNLNQLEKARKEFLNAQGIFKLKTLDNDFTLCQLNIANVLERLKRYPEAIEQFNIIDTTKLSNNDKFNYYHGIGVALWKNGQKQEALNQLTEGRKVLRQAMLIGAIDDSSLEFIETRRHLIIDAVRYALELKNFHLAFDAVQDGKAGVLGDQKIRQQQSITRIDYGSEFLNVRKDLCYLLRGEKERRVFTTVQRGSDDLEKFAESLQLEFKEDQKKITKKEIKQLYQAFFKTWRLEQKSNLEADLLDSKYLEKRIQIKNIQKSLPKDWALLDFWVIDYYRVSVFMITHDSFEFINLPHSYKFSEIEQALREILVWHSTGIESRDDALYLLYEILFDPLVERLKEFNGLYLVPHNFLHLVPLHACCDKEGCYLNEKFMISYLPSASLLPQLPPIRLNGNMLTLANPERGKPTTLPFSEWEAEEIKKVLALSNHQVWIGADATFEKTLNWQKTSVVHFSCHGIGSALSAALSHLMLADDLLLAHDVFYRHPDLSEGSIVVLNGCQTAVRDWRSVDEGLGLMTAFLLRGASIVLATQWDVDDLCASLMVKTFLEELVKNGKKPTDALQLAQTRIRELTLEEVMTIFENLKREAKIIEEINRIKNLARSFEKKAEQLSTNKDDCIYDHPVYWSAFHLMGRVE